MSRARDEIFEMLKAFAVVGALVVFLLICSVIVAGKMAAMKECHARGGELARSGLCIKVEVIP